MYVWMDSVACEGAFSRGFREISQFSISLIGSSAFENRKRKEIYHHNGDM